MKKWILLILALTFLSTSSAPADVIIPFSENNSIDVINGEVWVATHLSAPHITKKGYVLRFNPDTDEWQTHSFPAPVLSITHLDTMVWVATYGGGIFRLYEGEWEQFTVENTGHDETRPRDGLISNYVNSILIDDRNTYCATHQGLSVYDYRQDRWQSFDPENSPLPSPHIFSLDKTDDKLWLANSNYWYVYYELAVAGNEKGSIASYDLSKDQWGSFSGTRKKLTSYPDFVEIQGEIPTPNSNFTNVAVDDSGNVWFSFGGGVGVLRDNKWKVYTKPTCGVDLEWTKDIAVAKSDIWFAGQAGPLQYKRNEGAWIAHEKESDGIPGSVVTSVHVADNSVWVKSYFPGFSGRKGSRDDDTIDESLALAGKGVFHRLTLDGNRVEIKCADKDDWEQSYIPRYSEFLSLYRDGKWQSWLLTKRLIETLRR